MKDKDIKKMLSEGAAQVLPGDEVKRNVKYRIGADDEQVLPLSDGTAARHSRKPLIIVAVFAAVVAILCAVLIPYYLKNDSTFPVSPSVIGNISTIESDDDFYVYGAASMGALLSAQGQDSTTAAVKNSVKSAAKSALKTSGYTASEIADLLDEYMPYVEGMIGGGEITQTTAEQDEKYSDYEYSIAIGYPHIDGGYSTYVLYYNRTYAGTKTDGDETEEKYNIDGVLCVDGADYIVRGEHETETERGESEEEITFTVYSGGQPYIRLEQETEQEAGESEFSYTYTFYSNGKAVKTVEVEYEEENGETELSLTVEEGTNEYEFEFLLNSRTEMKVKAELNGEKYTIIVTIVDEVYYYSVK